MKKFYPSKKARRRAEYAERKAHKMISQNIEDQAYDLLLGCFQNTRNVFYSGKRKDIQ